MSKTAERLREYARAHPIRRDPLDEFNRLREPAKGEDDVSRFARLAACHALTFPLSETDYRFYAKIRSLVFAERARERLMWR